MNPASFAELGVPGQLCDLLLARGIDTPTLIQAAVIPDAIAGRDVLGRAPTGSGKTLAFGLPLLDKLSGAERRKPVALVLAPTRELAEQISRELGPLAAARRNRVAAVYGGVGFGGQRKALDAGTELLVACPGRLEDLLNQGALSLDKVRTVVLDEADRMADMGFLPSVRRILDLCAAKRQTLMFSATLDGTVAKLARDLQHQPITHEVGDKGPDISSASHLFWQVDSTERANYAAQVINTVGSTVVFCRTRHGADRLAKQLAKAGVEAAPIHGGRTQPQRDKALAAFARGHVQTLVATDVAARGIHVDGVAGVLHFDPPADAATYLHRSGRTARAGATGVVISLVDAGAKADMLRLQKHTGLPTGFQKIDLGALRPANAPEPSPVDRDKRKAIDMATGTVKFFNSEKGFGFISRPDGEDVFVHYSNIEGNGYRALQEGQAVEFEVGPGRKGPEAINVRAR